MTRSIKKGPYVDPKLLKKIKQRKAGDKTPIKTWASDSTISPEMVGFVFKVYNGKEFVEVKAREDMVGHRLGEFIRGKKFHKHGGQMQRELEKRK